MDALTAKTTHVKLCFDFKPQYKYRFFRYFHVYFAAYFKLSMFRLLYFLKVFKINTIIT